jgi:phospholipase C
VVGDLTSAFNFRTPNTAWKVRLPDTDDFKPVDLVRHPDQVPVPPADPMLPGQERGVRPARAIPYTLHADGHASAASFSIDFRSTGRATGVFQVRSADGAQEPRSYTVEPGKQLTDSWASASGYDLSVHGPNGFFRRFKGGAGGQPASLDIRARYSRRYEVLLDLENRGSQPVEVTVSDRYSSRTTTLSLDPGDASTERWSLGRTRGWYDLTVTVQGDPRFEYRYAGHLENGKASLSDPGMGGLI